MKAKNKFVYDADGVEFTIYEHTKSTKAGATKYWLLVDYSTGKRRILNNPTKEAAQRRADEIRAAMTKGQANRMSLSHGQWQEVCISFEVIRSHQEGYSLLTAVQEWSESRALLNGKATLREAVIFFLRNHNGDGPEPKPTRFADAAKDYHSFKVKDGKSKSHCKNIQSRLERLRKALPADVMLHELTGGQLEKTVVEFGLNWKTRNEYKILLNNLFRWAAKQNPPLVPSGFNPAKDMERQKPKHADVEFLHVNELRKVIAGVQVKRPDLTPLVVLVCFAGLRPSEAIRLDWSEIGEDYIRLPGSKSKTGFSRQIPIQPNLKVWLSLWRRDKGRICAEIKLDHLNAAILHCSGVTMPHDGMRHGFGTHREKIVQNVGAVASEMGNTPRICTRHYLNAFCTEKEAKDWFSIVPEKAANIIDLPMVQPQAGERPIKTPAQAVAVG